MFTEILNIGGGVFAIAVSVLGIVSFWRDKIKHRLMWILTAFAIGFLSISLTYLVAKERNEAELRVLKEASLRKDAKIVSDAIILSGWEEPGDYIGYLTQITGFYNRHKEQYQSEFDTYSRQLQEWQDFLKDSRKRDTLLLPSDWRQLKGIVAAGRDNLVQISK